MVRDDESPPLCDGCAFRFPAGREYAIAERIFDAWHDKQWTGEDGGDYLVSYSNYLHKQGYRLRDRDS